MGKSAAQRRELNDRVIKTLKPGAKRTRFWDTKQRGLVLQVEPTGHRTWKVAYRHNGKLRWYSLDKDGAIGLKEARDAARKTMARVVLGEDPHGERIESKGRASSAVTFHAVCERYLKEHAMPSRKAWMQGDKLRRRYVLHKLGARPVAEIKRADIRAIFNDLTVVQRHPVLANQVLAAIGAVFAWAIEQEILEHNPAHRIGRNKTRSRERVLSEAELPAFWRAFGGTAGDALKLILLTGQRPGEVRHMRGRDLELGEFTLQDNSGRPYKATGGWWTLPGSPDGDWPGTKNGRTHRVWLTETAVAIIRAHTDGSGGSVFRNTRGAPPGHAALGDGMMMACELAGVSRDNRVTAHDLRRTHGTTITSLGFSREQMNRIQNHAEGGIASVYDRHEYAHEACEIQRAVTARIMALAEGHTQGNIVELTRVRAGSRNSSN
jgi:integrase